LHSVTKAALGKKKKKSKGARGSQSPSLLSLLLLRCPAWDLLQAPHSCQLHGWRRRYFRHHSLLPLWTSFSDISTSSV